MNHPPSEGCICSFFSLAGDEWHALRATIATIHDEDVLLLSMSALVDFGLPFWSFLVVLIYIIYIYIILYIIYIIYNI